MLEKQKQKSIILLLYSRDVFKMFNKNGRYLRIWNKKKERKKSVWIIMSDLYI